MSGPVASRGVRTRLLRILSIIVIPVALGIIVEAILGYLSEVKSIQATQLVTASDLQSGLRARFAEYAEILAGEADAMGLSGGANCQAIAGSFMKRHPEFDYVRLVSDTSACEAGALAGGAPSRNDAKTFAADSRFVYKIDDGRLVLFLKPDTASGAPDGPTSLLAASNATLQTRLTPPVGSALRDVALTSDNALIASASMNGGATDWLPTQIPGNERIGQWRGAMRDGGQSDFTYARIADSDLAVLMRFDGRAFDDAWRRLTFLVGLPLVMLLALTAAYAHVIQRDVVRWIRLIEQSARTRTLNAGSNVLAPVDPEMPRELRSFAETFNTMASEARGRELELRRTLAVNQTLMLELHHRVKNSLQVIQSYMALARRAGDAANNDALVEMEARVAVLSAAYRMALAPGGIQPVRARALLDEVVSALGATVRRPNQWIAASLEWDGQLEVDRAIPLGLGAIEGLIAAIEAPGARRVEIALTPEPEGAVLLRVTGDGERAANAPPARIMAGLAAQLGASSPPQRIEDVLLWRFAP